jgi:membrane-associated phospholipid phosphatase
MLIFHSMTDVTLWITVTTFFLILFSTRKIPFYAAGSFVQEIFTSRKFTIHFIGLLSVLFFNRVELWIAQNMHYKADFTPSIHSLEGDFIPWFQHLFVNDVVTSFTSFVYVVIFTSLMIASIFIYTYEKNYKMFYAVCYAIIFNYAVAIPFYLFFSVSEVWSFLPNVQFLMGQSFPSFEIDYRPLSGLHNCFPSLHTSISVSMAVIALRSKNIFWGRFAFISSILIVFSIFYLGIHWLTDMCGGLILGVAAGRVGIRISEGRAWVTTIFNIFRKNRNFGKQSMD